MPNDFAAVPFIMHMRMALSVKSYQAKFFYFLSGYRSDWSQPT